MTAYQGGKKRIGKKIHDIIVSIEEDLNIFLPYFEPFVGMGGVLRHFGKDNNRLLFASDINIDLIMMWKALQKGWKPPLRCSRNTYNEFKYSEIHSAERAFIGVVASFGTNFFHAYRLHLEKNNKDYMREGYNGLMDILPDIKNVNFENGNYDEYNLKNHLIYCDPPYKGNNLSSKLFREFDHELFWDTMRKWSKKNIVFISESSAPEDFKKIWTISSSCSNKYENKKYSDNLYIHNTLYKKLSSSMKKHLKSYI